MSKKMSSETDVALKWDWMGRDGLEISGRGYAKSTFCTTTSVVQNVN